MRLRKKRITFSSLLKKREGGDMGWIKNEMRILVLLTVNWPPENKLSFGYPKHRRPPKRIFYSRTEMAETISGPRWYSTKKIGHSLQYLPSSDGIFNSLWSMGCHNFFMKPFRLRVILSSHSRRSEQSLCVVSSLVVFSVDVVNSINIILYSLVLFRVFCTRRFIIIM